MIRINYLLNFENAEKTSAENCGLLSDTTYCGMPCLAKWVLGVYVITA